MSQSIPSQHKAAQFKEAKSKIEIVTKETPKPQPGEILIKVIASGICASDHFTQQNAMGSPYPLSAGHEVVGKIASLGKDVHPNWKVGQLVGLGWNGGACTKCEPCRRGDYIHCDEHRVTGVTLDGGHQEYVIARENAVVDLPTDLNMTPSELAPLLCAGNTVYEALLGGNAKPGDLVVVQGLGGLGHLAIQIAAKAGYIVACISGSPEKADLAKQLGAHYYFSSKDDLPKEFKKIGLAKLVIATAPSGDAPKQTIPLLDLYGTLVIVGTPNDGKPLEVNAMDLISKYLRIQGLTCGSAASNDHFAKWCNQTGIKSMIKEWPLEKAAEAFDDTMNGKPKFRNVIVMPS